jgi:hypothetical protein
MLFDSLHELSPEIVSLVWVAVVASSVSVLLSSTNALSCGVSAYGSIFSAAVSVLMRSLGLPPGLYIETLSLECTLIPKLT